MDTKTQKALDLFKKKKFKEALRIFKTFKIGYTKDEKDVIARASEMLSGNENFYVGLGYNKIEQLNAAKKIIRKKYDLK